MWKLDDRVRVATCSNTGMKGKGGKSFCEQGEVKLRKLVGSAELDKLRRIVSDVSTADTRSLTDELPSTIEVILHASCSEFPD